MIQKKVKNKESKLSLTLEELLEARKRIEKNGGLKIVPITIDDSYKDKLDRLNELRRKLLDE